MTSVFLRQEEGERIARGTDQVRARACLCVRACARLFGGGRDRGAGTGRCAVSPTSPKLGPELSSPRPCGDAAVVCQ